MSVRLRNNAFIQDFSKLNQKELSGEGDGYFDPAEREKKKIKKKGRLSYDPAEELFPGARFLGFDPDFEAIIEHFDESPLNPEKRKKLGPFMGVFAMDYQGAKGEERQYLRALLNEDNAQEGYAAHKCLHTLGCPQFIRRSLAFATAQKYTEKNKSKNNNQQGFGGWLSAPQAKRAAIAYKLLGQNSRLKIREWLFHLEGNQQEIKSIKESQNTFESFAIKQALLLKALSVRIEMLSPFAKNTHSVLGELKLFFKILQFHSLDWLKENISYTNIKNPVKKSLAYTDPIYALKVHSAFKKYDWHEGESKENLIGEKAFEGHYSRTRIHWALALNANITPLERFYFHGYIGGEEKTVENKKHIEKVSHELEKLFDCIYEGTIQKIQNMGKGYSKYNSGQALGDLCSAATGVTYQRRDIGDDLSSGLKPGHRIVMHLLSGFSVPLTIRHRHQKKWKEFFSSWWIPVTEQNNLLQSLSNLESFQVISTDLQKKVEINKHLFSLPEGNNLLGKDMVTQGYYAPIMLDLLAAPFGFPLKFNNIHNVFSRDNFKMKNKKGLK